MDERCTCFPQRQQLRSSSSCFFLGRGADLVAPSAHGGSPWHSQLELLRGLVAAPGGGEQGRVGAMLGPSVSSCRRGHGAAPGCAASDRD